jgi:hypothetical protein
MGSGELRGVAGISSSDVWAVGSPSGQQGHAASPIAVRRHASPAGSSGKETLIEHWNGKRWSITPDGFSSQNADYADFNSVAVASARNAWAVGFHVDESTKTIIPLIDHWNGFAWHLVNVPTPDAGLRDDQLQAVAAVGPHNVWAAGFRSGRNTLPLLLHWDGARWTVTAGPSLLSGSYQLNSLAAAPGRSLWSVGYGQLPYFRTLIERIIGVNAKVVPSPNPPGEYDSLFGVSAVSKHDIWAVGTRDSSGLEQTLAEHWNGVSWTAVAAPNPGAVGAALSGVAARSASDVWAAGHYIDPAGLQHTLAERWNGHDWRIIASPSPYVGGDYFTGVAVMSPRDVWAVGNGTDSAGRTRTLIEHWNGTTWKTISSPNPSQDDSELYSVAGTSAKDVWTVGAEQDVNGREPIVEHWNGKKWRFVPSPSFGGGMSGGELMGVATLTPKDAWAVGVWGEVDQTLTEHWNGTNWTVVPSPNPAGGYLGQPYSGYLNAVSAASARSIWSVGVVNFSYGALIEHWKGSAWNMAPSTHGTAHDHQLYSVASVSPSDAWAVGSASSDLGTVTVIVHHGGC